MTAILCAAICVTLFLGCAPASRARTLADSRCAVTERGGACVLWNASIVELIARPEEFDGRRVRVIGFVNFEFEGNALYLGRADWEHSISRNGLWIDPPGGFKSDSGPANRRPNREYVIVEAVFRAGSGGHFGMWSGTLTDVTRLDRWARIDPDTIPIREIRLPPA